MAARAAGLSFDEFDAWSAGADNYDPRAARDTWRSIKDGKGVGPGTLFHMARQHGLPAGAEPRSRPQRPRRAEPAPSCPGPGAVKVWLRCAPATAEHGYIVAKDGTPDGLRVVPAADPLRIAGAAVAGWLVVPVLPLDGGEPASLQFIPPPGAGKKLNLPGASMAGAFVVGELQSGGLAYLVEGIGQGWACWKATGAAAVVCFGWGNVRRVAAELRRRDPSARLVLVPDAGKEEEAAEIAVDISGAVATMPTGWPENSDVNDLAQRDGYDLLEQLLSDAAEVAASADVAPVTWVEAVRNWQPPADLDALDVPVQFAVEGWIQAGKVGALVAAGSTGKTTLLLILGICIALGRDFFGCAVMRGTFVLLSPDDSQHDLNVALSRVCKALDLSAEEKSAVTHRVRVVSLQGLPGVKTFTAAAQGAVVDTGLAELILQAVAGIDDLVGIALDTLRQFSGGNSNDEQVIKLTITGATEVAQRTGAFVILPHHTGKQNYRDGVADMYAGSGSAAIADNCRFVLLLQTTTWADIEAKVRRTGQEQGAPLVLTSTRGSLLVRAPEPMFLHRDGYCIERVAGAVLTSDQQADDRDRAVLRAVRDGRQTKTEIAAVVRGRKADTLTRVDALISRGLLTIGNQSGTGKLLVTGRGAAFLDAA
jgi:RecA-family ATPase